MPHLKFFQERCSSEIGQQRGQCLWSRLSRGQWCWHMLKNITWNARMGVTLIRISKFLFPRYQLYQSGNQVHLITILHFLGCG